MQQQQPSRSGPRTRSPATLFGADVRRSGSPGHVRAPSRAKKPASLELSAALDEDLIALVLQHHLAMLNAFCPASWTPGAVCKAWRDGLRRAIDEVERWHEAIVEVPNFSTRSWPRRARLMVNGVVSSGTPPLLLPVEFSSGDEGSSSAWPRAFSWELAIYNPVVMKAGRRRAAAPAAANASGGSSDDLGVYLRVPSSQQLPVGWSRRTELFITAHAREPRKQPPRACHVAQQHQQHLGLASPASPRGDKPSSAHKSRLTHHRVMLGGAQGLAEIGTDHCMPALAHLGRAGFLHDNDTLRLSLRVRVTRGSRTCAPSVVAHELRRDDEELFGASGGRIVGNTPSADSIASGRALRGNGVDGGGGVSVGSSGGGVGGGVGCSNSALASGCTPSSAGALTTSAAARIRRLGTIGSSLVPAGQGALNYYCDACHRSSLAMQWSAMHRCTQGCDFELCEECAAFHAAGAAAAVTRWKAGGRGGARSFSSRAFAANARDDGGITAAAAAMIGVDTRALGLGSLHAGGESTSGLGLGIAMDDADSGLPNITGLDGEGLGIGLAAAGIGDFVAATAAAAAAAGARSTSAEDSGRLSVALGVDSVGGVGVGDGGDDDADAWTDDAVADDDDAAATAAASLLQDAAAAAAAATLLGEDGTEDDAAASTLLQEYESIYYDDDGGMLGDGMGEGLNGGVGGGLGRASPSLLHAGVRQHAILVGRHLRGGLSNSAIALQHSPMATHQITQRSISAAAAAARARGKGKMHAIARSRGKGKGKGKSVGKSVGKRPYAGKGKAASVGKSVGKGKGKRYGKGKGGYQGSSDEDSDEDSDEWSDERASSDEGDDQE